MDWFRSLEHCQGVRVYGTDVHPRMQGEIVYLSSFDEDNAVLNGLSIFQVAYVTAGGWLKRVLVHDLMQKPLETGVVYIRPDYWTDDDEVRLRNEK